MNCNDCPFGDKWEMAVYHEEICNVCQGLQLMLPETRKKLMEWILKYEN